MKKAVWISLAASLVIINLAAWLVERFTGFYIEPMFRVTFVMGTTVITSIFVGAFMLVNNFENEKPLTGSTHNTLQDPSATGADQKNLKLSDSDE